MPFTFPKEEAPFTTDGEWEGDDELLLDADTAGSLLEGVEQQVAALGPWTYADPRRRQSIGRRQSNAPTASPTKRGSVASAALGVSPQRSRRPSHRTSVAFPDGVTDPTGQTQRQRARELREEELARREEDQLRAQQRQSEVEARRAFYDKAREWRPACMWHAVLTSYVFAARVHAQQRERSARRLFTTRMLPVLQLKLMRMRRKRRQRAALEIAGGLEADTLLDDPVLQLFGRPHCRTAVHGATRKFFMSSYTLLYEGEEAAECYVIASGTVTVLVAGQEVAELGRGDVVGAMGMVCGEKTTRRAVCKTDTVVDVLTRDVWIAAACDPAVFERAVGEVRARHERNMPDIYRGVIGADQLLRYPLLRDVPTALLADFRDLWEPKALRPGDRLLGPDERPWRAFIILNGTVDVRAAVPRGSDAAARLLGAAVDVPLTTPAQRRQVMLNVADANKRHALTSEPTGAGNVLGMGAAAAGVTGAGRRRQSVVPGLSEVVAAAAAAAEGKASPVPPLPKAEQEGEAVDDTTLVTIGSFGAWTFIGGPSFLVHEPIGAAIVARTAVDAMAITSEAFVKTVVRDPACLLHLRSLAKADMAQWLKPLSRTAMLTAWMADVAAECPAVIQALKQAPQDPREWEALRLVQGDDLVFAPQSSFVYVVVRGVLREPSKAQREADRKGGKDRKGAAPPVEPQQQHRPPYVWPPMSDAFFGHASARVRVADPTGLDVWRLPRRAMLEHFQNAMSDDLLALLYVELSAVAVKHGARPKMRAEPGVRIPDPWRERRGSHSRPGSRTGSSRRTSGATTPAFDTVSGTTTPRPPPNPPSGSFTARRASGHTTDLQSQSGQATPRSRRSSGAGPLGLGRGYGEDSSAVRAYRVLQEDLRRQERSADAAVTSARRRSSLQAPLVPPATLTPPSQPARASPSLLPRLAPSPPAEGPTLPAGMPRRRSSVSPRAAHAAVAGNRALMTARRPIPKVTDEHLPPLTSRTSSRSPARSSVKP